MQLLAVLPKPVDTTLIPQRRATSFDIKGVKVDINLHPEAAKSFDARGLELLNQAAPETEQSPGELPPHIPAYV